MAMPLQNMVHVFYAHNNAKHVNQMENVLNVPNQSIIHNLVQKYKILINASKDRYLIV